MPKKFIQRFTINPDSLKNNKRLQVFGSLLQKPNLWALSRRSVPGAFAIGLFIAWIPVPFQMLLAAGLAIYFNVNLPISVSLVWITNPLTIAPMFYLSYTVGIKILGSPPQEFTFEASWAWLQASVTTIGPPFFVGCLVLGTICSIIGYYLIKLLWQHSIYLHWKKRQTEK